MDTKPKRFGFLVHYVENWNWLFNFRPDLQMEEAQRRRALWPACLMSLWSTQPRAGAITRSVR